jgi:hypothetical protein
MLICLTVFVKIAPMHWIGHTLLVIGKRDYRRGRCVLPSQNRIVTGRGPPADRIDRGNDTAMS